MTTKTDPNHNTKTNRHSKANKGKITDVDEVYERRLKPLCPHLEITSR